jgi:predicted aspartyl protease
MSRALSQSYTGICNAIQSQIAVSLSPALEKHGKCNYKNFKGLWDTGATHTVISAKAVRLLRLIPVGKTRVWHAQGDTTVPTYYISVKLPGQIEISGITALKGKLSDVDVLIGMDIINRGDFIICNCDGKTTFRFRMPSVGVQS